jgi:hypothetical protein
MEHVIRLRQALAMVDPATLSSDDVRTLLDVAHAAMLKVAHPPCVIGR